MRRLIHRQRLALLAASVTILAAGAARAAETIALPAAPAELLQALPPVPESYSLTISQAKHLRQNPPRSTALREYTATDVEEGAEPAVVRVQVIDTTGRDELLRLYRAPASGQEDVRRPGRRFRVDSMPAVERTGPDGKPIVEALAGERFIVVVTGLSGDDAEDWLKRVDVNRLRQAANTSGTLNPAKSYAFVFESIDEINPKRSKKVRAEIAGTDDSEG